MKRILCVLLLLLDLGADVNAKNRRGSTPLHWAIHDESKVRVLVARGASVNVRQVEGRTPLYLAALLGNGHPIVRLLLAHGADPSIASANGMTPLMAAATRGDVDALRLLLDAKADVNARDGAGETALMFAASDGNPRACELLLDRGADPRVRTKRNETALGNAGTSGSEEAVGRAHHRFRYRQRDQRGVGAARLRHERRAGKRLHRCSRARDSGDADAAGQLVVEREPPAADERRRFSGGGARHLCAEALRARWPRSGRRREHRARGRVARAGEA